VGGDATARTRGVSAGGSDVHAQAEAVAGDGGGGVKGAGGGTGGHATLTDAAIGMTLNGVLFLQQSAAGGPGGDSDGGRGGDGGTATSALDFNDTANANVSATLTFSNFNGQFPGQSAAFGGDGGFGFSSGNGGEGGAATAATRLTGARTVSAQAYAVG